MNKVAQWTQTVHEMCNDSFRAAIMVVHSLAELYIYNIGIYTSIGIHLLFHFTFSADVATCKNATRLHIFL